MSLNKKNYAHKKNKVKIKYHAGYDKKKVNKHSFKHGNKELGKKTKPALVALENKEIENLINLRSKLKEEEHGEKTTFEAFPLSKKTLKGLSASGFVEPTKVQSQTFIYSLQGLDVVGAAKTGSGKTLAFIVPLLETLFLKSWNQVDGLGALIITPVRELAYQIFEVINSIGQFHTFSVGLVIGGKDLKHEWSLIYSCNILICTPGRLLQHLTENPQFNADYVQILILDEADQCLSMGFAETMNLILQELPSTRQTILFSATQTRDVKDLIRAGCQDPVFCSVHEFSQKITPKTLRESYIICEDYDKISFLWSFIKHHRFTKILVFMSTCNQVKFLGMLAQAVSPSSTVLTLQGDMHQIKRMRVYDIFCKEKRKVLFATDVAARGLDFAGVNWVVHFDCPEDVTTYIHRSGRTARLSKDGESLLLLTSSQEEPMLASLKMRNINVEKINVDTKKIISIQTRIDITLSKKQEMRRIAENAFKSYVKSFMFMKNKKIFDITTLDLDMLARSLGLSVTPRVRFVERKLKQMGIQRKTPRPSFHSSTNRLKTFNLGINQDESESDEEGFLVRSKNPVGSNFPDIPSSDGKSLDSRAITESPSRADDSESNNQDDADDASLKENRNQEKASTKYRFGINIEKKQNLLKDQDELDKQQDIQRRKELRKKKKLKHKLIKPTEEEDEDYSEDDRASLLEIIDGLPDPDKVRRETSEDESDSDQSLEKNEVSNKRTFKGKWEAKTKCKQLKRARIAQKNDLNAIPTNEKEDLALFLLQNSR